MLTTLIDTSFQKITASNLSLQDDLRTSDSCYV